MAVPGNWSMVRVYGYVTDDDNDPLTGTYTLEVTSSAARLTDTVSNRVVLPERNIVTPDPTTGYFFWDQLSDTDPDVTPTGRKTNVTLLKSGTPVQSWSVTIDHATAAQVQFDVSGNVVGSGGTAKDAIKFTAVSG